MDEDDDIDEGDEEYEEDDDVDGDLCDFDELKDLEDEMDNEALEIEEEDLSATLNPAAHQLTERVSEIKMTESSTDTDILKTQKDNTENVSVDESVSRELSAVDYNDNQTVSSRTCPPVNSNSQDNYCITPVSVSQFSPKSQNLVSSLDPSVDTVSAETARVASVVHSSNKELSPHIDLLSAQSPQEQSTELSVTTSLVGQNANSVAQATTPAGEFLS